MNRFEDELRNALRREEPPEGFAARVLARAAAEPERRSVWARIMDWFRMPMVARTVMAAGLCLMVVAGVQYEQQRRERIRGEAAKQRLLVALRVTGSSLRAVHDKVRELNANYADAQ